MNCPSCSAAIETDAESCFHCGHTAIRKGVVVDGRYEILERLGKGGMGVVYRAFDRRLEVEVALKFLLAGSQSPDLTKRFRSEIKLARMISHRNVCRIHDYGEQDGRPYISMELIEGTDLKQLIKERGPLPKDEALDIALQVTRGLDAIHEAGIIHRDLKTPNLMLDSRGVIRLMDFGIAKRFAADGASATRSGQIIGTPEYMSPEQARGSKVDFRSDIYALGVIVFELFTGDVPFRGDTPVATILKHLQEAPPLDIDASDLIPPPLLPVLRRALAKDPADRFQSAAEIEQALRKALVESLSDGKASRPDIAAPTGAVVPKPDTVPVSSHTMVPTPVPTLVPTPVPTPVPGLVAEPPPIVLPPLAEAELQRGPSHTVAATPAPTPAPRSAADLLPAALSALAAADPEEIPSHTLLPTPAPIPVSAPLPDSAPVDLPEPPAAAPLPVSSVTDVMKKVEGPADLTRPLPAALPSVLAPPVVEGRSPWPPRPMPARRQRVPWWAVPALGLTLVAAVGVVVFYRWFPGFDAAPAARPPAVAAALVREAVPAPLPPTTTVVAPEPPPTPAAAELRVVQVAPTARPTPRPSPRHPPSPRSAEASAQPGQLQCVVRPWAAIRVNGQMVGTTPFRPISFPPGAYTVEIEHPEFQPLLRRVQVPSGGTVRVEVDLNKEGVPRR